MGKNETTLEILDDLRGEFNIVKAGTLAHIRVLDRVIKIMEADTEFVENYNELLDLFLDRRNELKKMVTIIASDILKLQDEIEKESSEQGNQQITVKWLYTILRHF